METEDYSLEEMSFLQAREVRMRFDCPDIGLCVKKIWLH